MIPPDLQTQILRMIDGELSAGELVVLEAELMANEDSRRVYRQLATLHSDLEIMHAGKSILGKSSVVPINLVEAKQRKRVFKLALYATAAVIMISMMLLHFTRLSEQPIASFRTTPSADFSLTHEFANNAPVGQVLVVGSKVELRKGVLESKFGSGVRVILEGPCVLRVLANDRVAIDQGVAWFEVPEKAVGFTVETAKLTVVDLGTAFGVSSLPTKGGDEVHVTRGFVEATAKIDGAKSETLREGEARRVNDDGELEEIKVDEELFTSSFPANKGLMGHWSFEGVIDGEYVTDSSGNGHTGSLKGGASIVTDSVRGKVLSLSGLKTSGDMVDIDSIKEIPDLLAGRGVTFAAWIKRNDNATAGDKFAFLIGLGNDGDNPVMSLGVKNSSGFVSGLIEGDGADYQIEVTGDRAVVDGVWTHIAVTYDRLNDRGITYVNGVAQGKATDISLVGDGTLDWQFGMIGKITNNKRGSNTRFFGGLIDDVRIYDRPLSAKEIRELAK